MINWKELEKIVAPGKVITLVIMVDGKEIGALSFNVDTLAYKEILEVAKAVETVKIVDKPEKKSEPAKTTKKSESVKVKSEPELLDDDEDEEEDEDNDEDVAKTETDTGKIVDIPEVKTEHFKPMTREQIMAAEEQSKPQGPAKDPAEKLEIKKEEKKVEQQSFGEEW